MDISFDCFLLFNVENYNYNENGEAIVLMSYSGKEIIKSNVASQLMLYADLYESFIEGDLNKDHNILRFELLCGAKKNEEKESDYFTNLVKKRDHSLDIESWFNVNRFVHSIISLSNGQYRKAKYSGKH